MPKCKMSNCREEALPTGKRYCAHHRDEYFRKMLEFEMVRRNLRACECCGQKLSKTRHDADETICGSCEEDIRAERAVQAKWEGFDAATTVEQLKDWLREHVLK